MNRRKFFGKAAGAAALVALPSAVEAAQAKPMTRAAALRAILSLADRCEKSGHIELAERLTDLVTGSPAPRRSEWACQTDMECETEAAAAERGRME